MRKIFGSIKLFHDLEAMLEGTYARKNAKKNEIFLCALLTNSYLCIKIE